METTQSDELEVLVMLIENMKKNIGIYLSLTQ
jgi:hypothetical protein